MQIDDQPRLLPILRQMTLKNRFLKGVWVDKDFVTSCSCCLVSPRFGPLLVVEVVAWVDAWVDCLTFVITVCSFRFVEVCTTPFLFF